MREHLSAASAKLAARMGRTCALALLAGIACQSAPAASPSTGAGAFPLVIHQSGGAGVRLDHQPRRIVSLSPTATEMLFAIGAGKQVVAVDDQSTYPANAPVTKLNGFQPNVEAVAGYTPDLVVAAEDNGGLVAGLTALNVPALLEPAAKNLDDSYAQIRELGAATGHAAEAGSVVAKMRTDVAAVVGSVSKPARRISVYHELDDTYYSATSKTFVGQVYTLLGIQNIADRATGAAPDYPQLSSEFVVSSNPDLIVLADSKCCSQNLQTVAARPGWGAIAAVRGGQVVGVDDDIASHWGPRIVDFMRQIAPHVSQLERQAA
ncbi:MAG TPA: ABC transporter substrate-binding protein [Terriglobales bacterium]|nr:ABC transporter substrate-binding protein [Terriglobales bacterium]